jgi:putative PEP-CTERM system TPR-repeat lipoprotein
MNLINNKVGLAVCLALSLTACSPNQTPEEYISAAKINISNEQHADAIIALKNAIRTDLKNSEARLLLGSIYLSSGEAASAEKELHKALTLGALEELVLPKLLKSYNLQGKNDKTIELLEDIEYIPVEIIPEVSLYKALAYIQVGENAKAAEVIAEANEISDESVYSQLGQTYLQAGAFNIEQSLDSIDQILLKSPELTEAILLKGQLLVIKEDYPEAITAFNAYFKLLPSDVKIRLYLANAYIKNQQFTQGEQHVDYLLKSFPEHAFSNQLKGLIHYQRKEYLAALSHTEKAIQNGMPTNSNNVVAGLSAFQLKEYERAHQYLITTVGVLPNDHPVRRILASVQIHLGYTDDAGEVLNPLESESLTDADLFSSASIEFLKSGNINEAKSLLSKAEASSTGSAESLMKIGILKLSMNDVDGMTDLEKATQISPNSVIANMVLVSTYLQKNELDKAYELAKKWHDEEPKEVMSLNLLAKVLLAKGEVNAAEVKLNEALSIDNDNTYSILYFSNKAIDNNKPKMAIVELDKILTLQPDSIKALDLYYKAKKSIGEEGAAIDKISRNYSLNKQNLNASLLYAKVAFIENNFSEVIDTLTDLNTTKGVLPPLYWILLGDSYFKIKENQKALSVYSDWVRLKPNQRLAQTRNISALERAGSYADALSSVESILINNPEDEQFKILLPYYQVLNKQFKQAQNQLNNFTEETKGSPFIKGLQGQILLSEGKNKEAVPLLKSRYQAYPTSKNATFVFLTLLKEQENQSAFEFMDKHLDSHPQDIKSRNLLADLASTVDQELAKKHYLILLDKYPNDVLLLNNAAWMEYMLSNYKSADGFAARALKISNDNSQVLDTAGLIKLKLGNKDEAISLLKRASELSPEDKVIEQHYQEAIK